MLNLAFSHLISAFGKLLLPLILLVISYLGINYLPALDSYWNQLLLQTAPLIFAAIALLLSQQFNRSRLLFLILFILLAAAMQRYPQSWLSETLQQLLCACLLLNLLVFSVFKDRNFFSIHGLLRVVFIGSQLLMIGYLYPQYAIQIDDWLTQDLFAQPAWLSPYLQLTDGLLLFVVSIPLLQLLLHLLRPSRTCALFLASELALLAILSQYQTVSWVPLLVIACCLMVCIDVLIYSHDMAYRDELTGLPSRRALNQLMLSLGRRYTIAMMDIDHFKKFNDTHGHDVGDEVLRMVASKIAQVKGGGKAFRYGGEEFTVVFRGKTPDQAEPHLEALRLAIENYAMVIRQKKRAADEKPNAEQLAKRGQNSSKHKTLSVTISIGLAERTGEEKTPEQVIKAADEALYRAKKAGRNCVQR